MKNEIQLKTASGKSRNALLLICISFIIGLFFYPKFLNQYTEALLSWDSFGYYIYLPAKFIYNDIAHLGFMNDVIQKYQPIPVFDQGMLMENGNYVLKYTMGQAIFYAPFFFIAHSIAVVFSLPADGFSFIYQLMMTIGMLSYAMLALIFLRKVLLAYFNDSVTAITLILLVLGSNYYNYVVYDGMMSHNLQFFLYSTLIYLTYKWHLKPGMLSAAAIGLTLGAMTLIRPTEVIAVIIPVLWGIHDKESFSAKLNLVLKHYKHIIILIPAFIIAILPQLLYWKSMSGSYVVYSYKGQGFNFLHPHLYDGIFSYKKGWLIYTPLMIAAVAGLIMMIKNRMSIAYMCLIYFIINTYIVFSWDEWWYGGSFGARAMVQSYAVLSFPLAVCTAYMTRDKIRRLAFFILGAVCIIYNLWGTKQAHKGIFHSSNITKSFFWQGFANPFADESAYKFLDISDEIRNPSNYTFHTSNRVRFSDSLTGADTAYIMKADENFSPGIFCKARDLKDELRSGDFIRASADVLFLEINANEYDLPALVISFERDGKPYKWEGFKFQRLFKEKGKWHHASFESKVPEGITGTDDIKIYIMNYSGFALQMDNIEMQHAIRKK